MRDLAFIGFLLALIGLGLNKMGRSVQIEDTPDNMGAIRKVAHMVRVETA